MISKMLKNLELGTSGYLNNKIHKPSSDHWDVFNNDFYNLVSNINNWDTFRRNGLTCMLETGLYGRDRADYIKNKKLYDRLYSKDEILEIEIRIKELEGMIGKDFLYNTLECEVGDPRHCVIEDYKINFDDLYNVYAAWQIYRTFKELNKKPTTILEIGGGYGGLCNKLTKIFPNVKYIILDLPESLLVQEYFLSKTDTSRNILTLTDVNDNFLTKDLKTKDYNIALLPGWYGDKLKEIDVDLVINMRSFGEMNTEVLNYYFNVIHKALIYGGIFYCVNRYVFTSSIQQLKIKDYPFDKDWNFIISQPQWLQTHLHEFISLREKSPLISPEFILKSMSERVPPPGPVMDNILTQKEWFDNNKKK